ncbi:hypothetical protein N7468_004477 [Penicillium chermesinum]|uniref:BZIP domain-containing protein n=1 Tax=Penicillium chermesinum TaxID=63820 RepID=A0A9W9TT88_9EURO|nr:uncharacterized protein N7468_004477 [Penicillium chermesinum]KAJ5239858.1 hypothetical protein N7468_004477 [Penicillium chermesinum]KAJ6166737.1 hypothetical protein N7470_002184 [Penicillium chermesinum]
MPDSERKRKLSARSIMSVADDQQREKKRLQNRISQQCFREKQATYIRHLEQFVDSIEKADGFSTTNAAENLRLIRENHALRESLNQMRKKLLSFSAQAASMAMIHDDIINRETVNQESNSSSSGVECPRLKPADSEATENGDSVDEVPAPLSLDTRSHVAFAELTTGADTKKTDPPPVDQTTPVAITIAQHTTEYHAKNFCHDKPSDNSHDNHAVDTDISTFFAGDCVKFSPSRGLIICKPPNASTKSPLLLLEAMIQKAIQQFNVFSLHDAVLIRPFVSDLSEAEVQQINNQTLSQIVHLAADALIQGSRMGGYSHVICPTPVLEKVLLWRCNPTSENRNRIELPFRPTVLQQRFPDHHPAIDLLYWGELRDQLILCQEEIEISTVVYRWQLSSVIEFPEQGASLSVLELFIYLANPTQFTLKSGVNEDGISIPLADVTVRDVTDELEKLITTYRLDQFGERKLPPWIGEDYPFIDMTNISIGQFFSFSDKT